MTRVFDPNADHLGKYQDDFYEALMASHDGLSQDQSNRLNARLVLIMANQIGDIDLLKSILSTAGKDSERGSS
jgi:hypothetical protein